MQKITPHLWFKDQTEEAVKLYTSLFDDSKIGTSTKYNKASAEVSGQPEGSLMTQEFELSGHKFLALNGGPAFSITPAISLTVHAETKDEINMLWDKLSEGGTVRMELDKYPFSERYGWIEDKFGLSWQLILVERSSQKIVPSLMYAGAQQGKAEEAMKFYTFVFDDSGIDNIAYYEGQEGQEDGTVAHAVFTLENQQFIAMDSALDHGFTFTEAFSLMVHTKDQEETDFLWEKLSADPKSEQCGWLKDKFGVSWQIVPEKLYDLLSLPDKEKANKVMEAMLEMKKIEIEKLEKAAE